MKKVLSIVLAIAMIATMSAVAFAAEKVEKSVEAEATLPADGLSAEFDVMGSYIAVADTANYKVDITWSNTEFVYKDAGTHWDVDEHKWIEDTKAMWEGEGTITVENHSSKEVMAAFVYAAEGANGTAMAFTQEDVAVPAEGVAVAAPDVTADDAEKATDPGSVTVDCTITAGAIDNVDAAKIGAITVTIN